MRKINRILAVVLILFVQAAAIIMGSNYLANYTLPSEVSFIGEESELFRAQQISDENLKYMQNICEEQSVTPEQVLAAAMAMNKFSMQNDELNGLGQKDLKTMEKQLMERYPKEYEQLLVLYGKIWKDVQYFPVPESKTNQDATVSFENSWMFERNFGGKRGHEGTDIMAGINKRGYYPVVSMTDGVVEKIGWLTKGGYRIGIRSPLGGYYYYAHLYCYADDIKAGDPIKAGQLIGYMGDSGYGSEGTVGQFAVHLHVGIYVNNEEGEEISINSYPVLKYFEEKTLQYAY